jgi:spore coat protein U-like protein
MIRLSAMMTALCLALAFLLWPGQASANVVCSLTGQTINFGTYSTATGSIGYSCINYSTSSTSLDICSTLGSPSWPGTTAQPRMLSGSGSRLAFNLYTDPGRSKVWEGDEILRRSISIPANQTVTGSLTFYGAIPSGQGAPAGNYTAYFYATSIGMRDSGDCVENVASEFDGMNNTLNVTATVSNGCTVSAGNLSLGSVASTSSSVAGSTNISVTCPSGTAYYIGLAPSNGSTLGAGTMTGTGGNTDQPAYQLRSAAGMSGAIWGNTATATSIGNGVSGTGNGAAQSHPAYVTLPSANYRPDSYSDTVTVNVNY